MSIRLVVKLAGASCGLLSPALLQRFNCLLTEHQIYESFGIAERLGQGFNIPLSDRVAPGVAEYPPQTYQRWVDSDAQLVLHFQIVATVLARLPIVSGMLPDLCAPITSEEVHLFQVGIDLVDVLQLLLAEEVLRGALLAPLAHPAIQTAGDPT